MKSFITPRYIDNLMLKKIYRVQKKKESERKRDFNE